MTQNSSGLSVVIPSYRDDDKLISLLHALRPLNLEQIIIAEAGSASRSVERIINDIGTANYLQARKGRGSQIAAGLAVATQNTIWILHADSQPDPNSVREIHKILSDDRVALGCFRLKFDAPHPWLNLFARFSHMETWLTTFGDQGFFFRRKDYEALALSLDQFPLLEDLALRRAFKRVGLIKKSSLSLVTSARRFERQGYLKTQLKNLGILIRYKLGESPAQLYQRYYGPNP